MEDYTKIKVTGVPKNNKVSENMLIIKQACEAIGAELPKEVDKFFAEKQEKDLLYDEIAIPSPGGVTRKGIYDEIKGAFKPAWIEIDLERLQLPETIGKLRIHFETNHEKTPSPEASPPEEESQEEPQSEELKVGSKVILRRHPFNKITNHPVSWNLNMEEYVGTCATVTEVQEDRVTVDTNNWKWRIDSIEVCNPPEKEPSAEEPVEPKVGSWVILGKHPEDKDGTPINWREEMEKYVYTHATIIGLPDDQHILVDTNPHTWRLDSVNVLDL